MQRLTVVQDGWCDSVGSVEEIQVKLLKRQEAAAKRERAMAYALAHQVSLTILSQLKSRKNKRLSRPLD